MALEKVSNVPEVCSGMLRLAPIALQIPDSPFPTVPSPETPGASLWHFLPPDPPPPPPGEKSWIRP